ncbi:alcohol dehydrogenase catalytic domain-containing protein [Rhodococcus koreensis]
MSPALRIHQHGGKEELSWEEVQLAPPGTGEVRLRHTAIGINFSDINVRRGGFYPATPPFPLVLGNEAAGVVEALGPGVTDLEVGDRVAYAGMFDAFYLDTGSYAEHRTVPAQRLVPIPDGVSDEQAAAVLLKGSTASLITNRIFRPGPQTPCWCTQPRRVWDRFCANGRSRWGRG